MFSVCIYAVRVYSICGVWCCNETSVGVHCAVPVRILLPGPELGEEGGGDGERGGEQPDQRDVDGVGPRPGHILTT